MDGTMNRIRPRSCKISVSCGLSSMARTGIKDLKRNTLDDPELEDEAATCDGNLLKDLAETAVEGDKKRMKENEVGTEIPEFIKAKVKDKGKTAT